MAKPTAYFGWRPKAGDAAIGAVDVQLVADPGLRMSLGIPLGAGIAVLWQVRQHLGHCHAELAHDPAWRLGRTDLILAGTAALALGLRDRLWLLWLRRFLACLDCGAVARDMPDQTIRVRFLDQCLMQPRCQGAVYKLGKGARERRLARNLAGALPATQAPQRLVGAEHGDQQAGGGEVEHRFGDEGAGQGRPLGGRTPYQAAPG